MTASALTHLLDSPNYKVMGVNQSARPKAAWNKVNDKDLRSLR